MKNILLLSFAIFFSGTVMASESELAPVAKELVFKAITDHVYMEENGNVRAPQKISDFIYRYISSEKVIVTGSSYSPFDHNVMTYKCDIDVIGRGIIESVYDFEIISCDVSF